MIQTLIYAYDPLKLDLHLRSRDLFFIGPDTPITVICSPNSLADFEEIRKIAESHKNVNAVQYRNDNILKYVNPNIELIQFMCDDVIWTQPFAAFDFVQKFNDKEILYISPRLSLERLGIEVNKVNYRTLKHSITTHGDIWRTEDYIKFMNHEERDLNDPGLATNRYHVMFDNNSYLVVNKYTIPNTKELLEEGKRIDGKPWLFFPSDTEEIVQPYDYTWTV